MTQQFEALCSSLASQLTEVLSDDNKSSSASSSPQCSTLLLTTETRAGQREGHDLVVPAPVENDSGYDNIPPSFRSSFKLKISLPATAEICSVLLTPAAAALMDRCPSSSSKQNFELICNVSTTSTAATMIASSTHPLAVDRIDMLGLVRSPVAVKNKAVSIVAQEQQVLYTVSNHGITADGKKGTAEEAMKLLHDETTISTLLDVVNDALSSGEEDVKEEGSNSNNRNATHAHLLERVGKAVLAFMVEQQRRRFVITAEAEKAAAPPRSSVIGGSSKAIPPPHTPSVRISLYREEEHNVSNKHQEGDAWIVQEGRTCYLSQLTDENIARTERGRSNVTPSLQIRATTRHAEFYRTRLRCHLEHQRPEERPAVTTRLVAELLSNCSSLRSPQQGHHQHPVRLRTVLGAVGVGTIPDVSPASLSPSAPLNQVILGRSATPEVVQQVIQRFQDVPGAITTQHRLLTLRCAGGLTFNIMDGGAQVYVHPLQGLSWGDSLDISLDPLSAAEQLKDAATPLHVDAEKVGEQGKRVGRLATFISVKAMDPLSIEALDAGRITSERNVVKRGVEEIIPPLRPQLVGSHRVVAVEEPCAYVEETAVDAHALFGGEVEKDEGTIYVLRRFVGGPKHQRPVIFRKDPKTAASSGFSQKEVEGLIQLLARCWAPSASQIMMAKTSGSQQHQQKCGAEAQQSPQIPYTRKDVKGRRDAVTIDPTLIVAARTTTSYLLSQKQVGGALRKLQFDRLDPEVAGSTALLQTSQFIATLRNSLIRDAFVQPQVVDRMLFTEQHVRRHQGDTVLNFHRDCVVSHGDDGAGDGTEHPTTSGGEGGGEEPLSAFSVNVALPNLGRLSGEGGDVLQDIIERQRMDNENQKGTSFATMIFCAPPLVLPEEHATATTSINLDVNDAVEHLLGYETKRAQYILDGANTLRSNPPTLSQAEMWVSRGVFLPHLGIALLPPLKIAPQPNAVHPQRFGCMLWRHRGSLNLPPPSLFDARSRQIPSSHLVDFGAFAHKDSELFPRLRDAAQHLEDSAPHNQYIPHGVPLFGFGRFFGFHCHVVRSSTPAGAAPPNFSGVVSLKNLKNTKLVPFRRAARFR